MSGRCCAWEGQKGCGRAPADCALIPAKAYGSARKYRRQTVKHRNSPSPMTADSSSAPAHTPDA
eukprot:29964-Eustigmatos_ZCMA.PRE.1